MKAYFLNITALVLFSAVIDSLLPPKWNKYIKTITALMVTAVIISPFYSFEMPTFEEFDNETKQFKTEGNEIREEMIKKELEERIREDISLRLSEEYGINPEVQVRLSVNEKDEITGVKMVTLSGEKISDEVLKRINEIYAPSEVTVREY